MSEALDNEQQPRPIHPAPSHRSAEEDRAWSQLYAAIYQASAAEEVVKQLEADSQSKRNHLALYIRAKATLREQKSPPIGTSESRRSCGSSRPSWS